MKLPELMISPKSFDVYYKVPDKNQYISQTMNDNPNLLRYKHWTYSFFIKRGFVNGDLSKLQEYKHKSQKYYRSLYNNDSNSHRQ